MTDNANGPVGKMRGKIDSVFEKAGGEGWIRCPSCHDEYNHLRTCQWQDEGKVHEFKLCVRCAETCKALSWIAENWPRGLTVSAVPKFPDQAYVSYAPSFIFRIWRDGIRLKMRREGMPDQVFDHENAISLYFAIWRTIRAGDDPNLEKGEEWGSTAKFERKTPIRRTGGRRETDFGGNL